MELIQSSALAAAIGVKQEALQYLSPIQQGWLQLAGDRVKLFEALAKGELHIQSLLKDIDTLCVVNPGMTYEDMNANWKKVTEAIQLANDAAGSDKEQRLIFTNKINDKIIAPSMNYEKNNVALITAAKGKEFILRKAVLEKQNEGQNKEREKAELSAHITNEYFRIATKYRNDLAIMIAQAYQNALQGKTPVAQIQDYKDNIIKFMKEIKLDLFIKYNRVHVNDAEAEVIFKSIRPYTGENDLIQALNALENQFSMYAEDLKNADKAIEHSQQSTKQFVQQSEQQLTIDQGTTALMANASVATVETTGGPKVKTAVAVFEYNNETWTQAVLNNFIRNWNICRKHIGIKVWSKLTILQMSTALGKAATESGKAIDGKGNVVQLYEGLELIKLEK